jgi:hypothetical protein
LRNCKGDEGRPFGVGDQVADLKPLQAAVVKTDGGERCRKVGTMIPAGKVERGERKQTASEASKMVSDVKTGDSSRLRDQLGGCPDTDRAASGV